MARPFHLRASDFTPRAKKRAAATFSAAHASGVSWPEIAHDVGISPRTIRSWASTDMTERAQQDRRSHSGRHCLLTQDEDAEILRRAGDQRSEHGVIDDAWTRATIADVTGNRLANVPDSFISRFWQRMGWPTRRVQSRSTRETRTTLQQEALEFQQTVHEYVRSRDIPPERVIVADETGM
jgi:transposase